MTFYLLTLACWTCGTGSVKVAVDKIYMSYVYDLHKRAPRGFKISQGRKPYNSEQLITNKLRNKLRKTQNRRKHTYNNITSINVYIHVHVRRERHSRASSDKPRSWLIGDRRLWAVFLFKVNFKIMLVVFHAVLSVGVSLIGSGYFLRCHLLMPF